MVSKYERLIQLATEADVSSTHAKIDELNSLLKFQNINEVRSQDLSLLDDLISILANTENIYVESRTDVLELQDAIRLKIYQS